MGKHYSIQERENILERYRQSGLSAHGFCRQSGFCYTTLLKWLRVSTKSETMIEVSCNALPAPPFQSASDSIESVRVELTNGIALELRGTLPLESVVELTRNLQRQGTLDARD